jgi:hypothetical protein
LGTKQRSARFGGLFVALILAMRCLRRDESFVIGRAPRYYVKCRIAQCRVRMRKLRARNLQ